MENQDKQEAQLSQKGRITLHVIENFDKSFKISQGRSKLSCVELSMV